MRPTHRIPLLLRLLTDVRFAVDGTNLYIVVVAAVDDVAGKSCALVALRDNL